MLIEPFEDSKAVKWKNLVNAIINNECILVLGPNIAIIEYEGQDWSLSELLARYLAKKLIELEPKAELLDASNLAYVAEQLEEAYMAHKYKASKAKSEIREHIKAFYEDYDFSQFDVYEEIAKLPFRFIINTCPDNFLLDAFIDNKKYNARSEYYHYRYPSHNNAIDANEDFPPYSAEAPLIYNLFGTVEESEITPSSIQSDPTRSLVITEADRLEFLDTTLQKEGAAGIPDKIALEFKKNETYDKIYLFLGFDFNNWHIRLLMHLINRYEKQKEGYALQNPNRLDPLTTNFYEKTYDLEFINILPKKFARSFQNKIKEHKSKAKAIPKLKTFIVSDREDKNIKALFDKHLALLEYTDLIEVFDEDSILAGENSNQSITSKIQQSDIIILLVTANLLSSDRLLTEQLQPAIIRHKGKSADVIPIIMKSCTWQNSIVKDLASSVLPGKNDTPIMEMKDPDIGLTAITDILKVWFEKIYKRKSRKQNR